MYPAHLLSLFPAFPRTHRVFVAMSFEPQFDNRWEQVIVPAVAAVRIDDVPLEAHRVDTRRVGDSILTEIVQGISESQLVLGDISTTAYLGTTPIRNGNVMYELGVAHASRLPEEVVLFRSDSDNLLFDVAGVRVNSYSPDSDPTTARQLVSEGIESALKEIVLRRSFSVRRAVEALGGDGLEILFEAQQGAISHPDSRTMGEVLGNAGKRAAINHLLSLGVISTDISSVDPDRLAETMDLPIKRLATYKLTPFGLAVFAAVLERSGMATALAASQLGNKDG